MSIQQSIAKNTIWHFAGKALGMLFGILSIALVTRYLGQEGFGWYATVFAWLQFFGILIDFGLYLILLSELGKTADAESKTKVIGNILSLRLISGFIILLTACGLIWFMPYATVVKVGTAILAGAFYFQLINQLFTGVFQAKLKMLTGSLVEVIGKFIGLLFTYLAIRMDWGFYTILVIMTAANFINLMIMWLLLKRYVIIKLYWDTIYWKKIIALAWPLAIGTIFNLFYFKADTLILSVFHDATEVGIYSAPYRMLEVLISLPPIFLGLIMPFLSRSFKEQNFEQLKSYLQKSFNVFALITIPLALGTLLTAPALMTLVAGQGFIGSAPLLRILIIATVFIFFAQLFSYVIIAMNEQRNTLKFIVAASIIAVLAYFAFIPRYSYWAAAIITTLTEGTVMLMFYFYIKKKLHWSPSLRLTWKILLAASIMSATILPILHLPIILILIVAVLVYGLAAWVLQLFDLKTFIPILKP